MPKKLIPFNPDTIPAELRSIPRWAPWRAVWNEKRRKFDKIPAFGLSTKHPEMWGSFDGALKYLQNSKGAFAGLGFCVTGLSGYVIGDLDRCVEGGVIAPWAREILAQLDSYTEISPSGKGLRVIGKGFVDRDWCNHATGIEIYGGHAARFLTFTGARLDDTPAEAQYFDPLAMLDLESWHARPAEKAKAAQGDMPELLSDLTLPGVSELNLPAKVLAFLTTGEADGDRSGALFASGVSLYAAGLSDAEVFSMLANNEFAMSVALDHRRQDEDRALLYLWKEHCLKARAKGRASIVSPDEFEVIPEDPAEPPKFKRLGKGRNEGCIDATLSNLALALARPDICGLHIRYDLFRDEIVVSETGAAWRAIQDIDCVRMRERLEKAKFIPIGRELMRDAVLHQAHEAKFDSAQDWLKPLRWDGIRRIDRFTVEYFGTDDTPYARAVSRYLWTALAGRILKPGIKADMALILVGEQGTIKSTSIAALAPFQEWFTEINFHRKDDDIIRDMRGAIIGEICELQGLHTREQESIKAFITRQRDKWIEKYQSFSTVRDRRTVFIGTTNQQHFLADATGNRRFLPLTVTKGDIEAIRRDCEQLWAEAQALFLAAGIAYQEAEALAKDVHADHMITDPWDEVIRDWLHTPDVLTGELPSSRDFLRVHDIARDALRLDPKQLGKREEMRICDFLRNCGYTRIYKRVDGKGSRVWVLVQPPETT